MRRTRVGVSGGPSTNAGLTMMARYQCRLRQVKEGISGGNAKGKI